MGHGSHTGTTAPRASPLSRSADEACGVRSGCTAPCIPHCHALDQALGSCTGPPHRGQVGVVLISRISLLSLVCPIPKACILNGWRPAESRA